MQWYEGGTLHQKKIGDWKAASDRDRLATSADFVANLREFDSNAAMRSAAEEMEECVSTAAEAASADQPVTELAAACAILLGYGN